LEALGSDDEEFEDASESSYEQVKATEHKLWLEKLKARMKKSLDLKFLEYCEEKREVSKVLLVLQNLRKQVDF